jgi:hypothetical protein
VYLLFGDFGYKETAKQKKRRILEENRQRGRRAELLVRTSIGRFGDKVTKRPYGPDLEAERKELFTGKVRKELIEVKSNDAPLSPLQKKVMKKKKFRVERVRTPF